MENQYSQEIMEEAAKWKYEITVERLYFERDKGDFDGNTKDVYERSPLEREFIVKDGKLIGFDLNASKRIYDIKSYEGELTIPDGKLTYRDSHSSHDWMYSVEEIETVVLKRVDEELEK